MNSLQESWKRPDQIVLRWSGRGENGLITKKELVKNNLQVKRMSDRR